MPNYIIDNDDMELLNCFVGYGKFNDTDMFFLGMEEGAAATEIEPGVVARLKYFGRNENGIFENLVDGENYLNGFTETSEQSRSEKVNSVRITYGLLPIEDRIKNVKFPTLNIIARICLYLQNDLNSTWFDSFNNINDKGRVKRNKIDHYNLFDRDDSTVKATALVDWKPLFRNNTKIPFTDIPVFANINEKLYHRAFERFSGDKFYVSLAEKRFNIIINQIYKSNAKVVIIFANKSIWNKEYMKRFTETLCPSGTTTINFDSDIKLFGREGYMENGTKVVWTYHPAAPSLPIEKFNYFRQVTEKCIAPVFRDENK